jgi:hypothetical protein
VSKECVTHHHACDCREEKFRQLEQENAALRADKERLDWIIGQAHYHFFAELGSDLEKGREQIDAARKEAQP